MNLLFIGADDDRPSTRDRLTKILPAFEEAGLTFDYDTVPDGFADRLSLFKRTGEYDAVFLQKKLFQPWETWVLRYYVNYLMYDLDDAVMFRHSKTGDFNSSTRMRKFRSMAKHADRIVAGNDVLAIRALEYNSNIDVIPTVVNLDRYQIDREHRYDKFTIGWVGTSSNIPYLEDLRPALERFGKNVSDASLKIICDEFISLDHLEVEKIQWDWDTEIEQLNTVNIGLLPLRRDPWCIGKCGYKLIQYMALGIPGICTPVGMNRELAVPGQTGFRAQTTEEWYEKLMYAYENQDELDEIGSNARRVIEEGFSIRSVLPSYMRIFEEISKS